MEFLIFKGYNFSPGPEECSPANKPVPRQKTRLSPLWLIEKLVKRDLRGISGASLCVLLIREIRDWKVNH